MPKSNSPTTPPSAPQVLCPSCGRRLSLIPTDTTGNVEAKCNCGNQAAGLRTVIEGLEADVLKLYQAPADSASEE